MKSKEILEIVKTEKRGYYNGNRLILPFRCQLIKLIANSHIYTEFVGSDDVKISQDAHNTSIYFRETGRLANFEGSYKNVKMIVAGFDEDLTEMDSHIKMICHIEENHKVNIEVPGDNVLFIE